MAKVKIFYKDGKNPDGSDHVSAKEGELIEVTELFISIKNEYGTKISFPMPVIRWEEFP